ncbi:MAG: cupin domain-containing protein [Rhodanobacteraceae bacterium]|nr:MAG: cupin domain-containing protein [Rhodanobacteraceae bacterium]
MNRILNIADAQYNDLAESSRRMGTEMPAERFGGRRAELGRVLGARKLGYNVTAIAPGKRAYPRHNHHVNEEMFLVLEGSGAVRIGDETFSVRAGDVIACPPGGPEAAHQLHNTGEVELKVLAVSTAESPEICDYPDSCKFGVLAFFDAGRDGKPQMFAHVGRADDARDYWEGE